MRESPRSTPSPRATPTRGSPSKIHNGNTNSCMLVNGNVRKLSNSYLRYQRRYSKHGYVGVVRLLRPFLSNQAFSYKLNR